MKIVKPEWPAPACIQAFTTTKTAWGGRHFKPIEMESTQDTYLLEKIFDLPSEPIWLNQTHSTIALPATLSNKEQIADASFTNELERVCVVSTADCLPLLICNTTGTKVAAIHAGWRGLAGGIIENTINALDVPGHELLVWLGPAIGPTKFEVGKDVFDAFTRQHDMSQSAFFPTQPGKWLANLYHLAKIRLNLLGIQQIYGGDRCTYSEESLFFSYRRDQGKTGRMASVIWIAKNHAQSE